MKTGSHAFLLGLGGNLGDRADFIGKAINGLKTLPGAEISGISDTFETDPVGYEAQGLFLNLCLSMTCELEPAPFLAACLALETQLGRVRSIKDGPRTVDIDVLFYREGPVDLPELTLPHPRWRERGFVVFPLRHLLQAPALAKDAGWDWLRAEVATLSLDGSGLRPWQGSTPWKHPSS